MTKRRRAAVESESEFVQFANALADFLKGYPAMRTKVDVFVDIRDREELAAVVQEFATRTAGADESVGVAAAAAAGPCGNCVPPRKCIFNARTRRFRCFP